MTHAPLLIAILGAESTGKTTLAQALARETRGLWVPEYLREFCETHSRTPTREEQSEILETQAKREIAAQIDAAKHGIGVVFCDTAPLMTAVYSDYIFSDRSLYARAINLHRRYAATIVLDTDLAWVADGIQRDGEHVRKAIDALIASALDSHGLDYARISGGGHERTLAALRVLAPQLRVLAPQLRALAPTMRTLAPTLSAPHR
jgi:nicotinamide riboside kinase